MAKVLVGCPTHSRYRYCLQRYIDAVKQFDYANYDLLLVDNSPDDAFYKELKKIGIPIERISYVESARERIVRSRNLIKQRALEGEYDYFFSLEQDIVVPPDTIKRLLAHNKKIVAGYYGKKQVLALEHKETKERKSVLVELPLVWLKTKDGKVKRANPEQTINVGLIEVGAIGVGCVLIAREVLEKIEFRYEPEKKAFDDMFFCMDARKLGYTLWLDSSIRAEHYHTHWGDVTK